MNLQEIIGQKEFYCTKDNTSEKLEKRMSKGILKKIKKNVKFCLGNAIKTDKLKYACDQLFKRDYLNKKQIFVPNYFIGEAHFDEKIFCSKLDERATDEHFSNEEKEYWNSKLKASKREATERILYELLREFYEKHLNSRLARIL